MPPKSTAVALDSSVPVIVTMVPPLDGPADGLMLVTVGAADVGVLVGLLVRARAAGGGDGDVDGAGGPAGRWR